MLGAGLIMSADSGALWAAVVPVCASIIGGAIAMAWRLGALDRTVKDLGSDIRDTNDRVAQLEQRVRGTNFGRRATDWPRRNSGGGDTESLRARDDPGEMT